MATDSQKKTERPPIVAVLGHVDHGKSTLLDYIRKSNTTDQEVGGITQRVSAYEVVHKDGHGQNKRITFIDTPGHEAFGAIRNRSTHLADIVILIVSAEDGVKEQTVEALSTVIETKTPFIVVVNKIDSDKANIEKSIGDLAKLEVFVEGRGGTVPYAAISAKTGKGVDELLELVLLVAELEELTGVRDVPAEGVVIEAHRDPKRGISGTLVITNGTLVKGGCIAAGTSYAPARSIENVDGTQVDTATFSSPVTIAGWNTLPKVGEHFIVCENKKDAEEYCKACADSIQKTIATVSNTEELDENIRTVPLIIKADVSGSIDALKHELEKLKDKHPRVIVKILRAEVGALTENDIRTAGGDTNAIVLGFNTNIDSGVEELVERGEMTMVTFNIIYKFTEWIEKELSKRAPTIKTEEIRGSATILKTFSATKKAQVVGGRVDTGVFTAGNKVRILRRGEEIGSGIIKELQVARAKVESVNDGSEFGIRIASDITIAPRDTLESVALVESKS